MTGAAAMVFACGRVPGVHEAKLSAFQDADRDRFRHFKEGYAGEP